MRDDFQNESSETKFALCQIVERPVRPLRATTAYKRRIREELLAHVVAIYAEEKKNNPATAVEKAARRFGDPAQLSRELASAISPLERLLFHFERFIAWRAPESAARYSFRLAVRIFLLAAVVSLLLPLLLFFAHFVLHPMRFSLTSMSESGMLAAMRVPSAVLILFPITLFLLFVFYYKIRDAIFGVFGSPKSFTRVALYSLLSGLTVFLACVILIAISHWNLHSTSDILPAALGASLYAVLVHPLLAWRGGPAEIDDTFWATLQL